MEHSTVTKEVKPKRLFEMESLFDALDMIEAAAMDGCTYIEFQVDNHYNGYKPYKVLLLESEAEENGYD